MFGIGIAEMTLIVVIAFVALGPEQMVQAAHLFGKWAQKLRRIRSEVESEWGGQLTPITKEVQQAWNQSDRHWEMGEGTPETREKGE